MLRGRRVATTLCLIAVGCLSIVSTKAEDVRPNSAVPPPGVHPRIFFSPGDLPEFKRNILESAHGKVVQKLMQKEWQQMRPELEAFAALDLSNPDAKTIAQYFKPVEGRNIAWGLITLDGVVHDDAAQKKLMAQVIYNYARLILASQRLSEGGATVGGTTVGGTGEEFGKTVNVWKSDDFNVSTSWLFGAGGFALSYDLLFNDMPAEQRDTVRAALAAATAGRRSFGADVAKGRAFSNWFGYHGELAVMLAAIEGEKGYDAAAYQRITKVLSNYFEIAYSEDGASHEDTYGPNLGLRAGSLGLLVMSRRGQDVFATERYRNIFRYVAQDLEPFPGGNMVGGASGNQLVYPTSVIVAKYKLPEDPVVNYDYRYLLGDDYQRMLPGQCWLDFALFGSDSTGNGNEPPTLAGAGLPLGVFYPYRGMLIARSDWSPNALDLVFDARPDAFAIGHDTVDRGTFELAALGRAWAVHRAFRDTSNSTDFNLVHIDGEAEKWKAPSVKILWHEENAAAAGAEADLKYAYHWQWTPPWPAKGEKFPPPWEPEMSDPRTLGWPDDPSWLPHKLYDEEGIGHVGEYLWRRPYNPVQMAFRTSLLARGNHPYVIIADEIRKDDQVHDYAWYMQLADDVKLDSTQGKDTILKDPKDNRRLLVRVLKGDGLQGAAQAQYTIGTNPKTGAAIPGNRLIVSAKTIEPHFRILLYPFHEGEPLPESSWDAAGTELTLAWPDQKDQLHFLPTPHGLQATLVRGGAELLTAKPAETAPNPAR
jgi:hypothetical protein